MKPIETLMWKELNQAPEILSGLYEKNSETIDAIAAEVKARGIQNATGAARGTSDHALTLFKYATEIFSGIKVGLAACSAVTMYDGKVDYGDNLVLGVSQSGKAADVLAVLERANAQGALTVAVTNNLQSPMAAAAKYHLYCACDEEKSVAATKTFSAQVYLLLALALTLGEQTEHLAQLRTVGDKLKQNANALSAAAEKLAEKIKTAQHGFILARGISYALALESTLKLQETCYMMMKGYAESDFQHGPMAMVGKGTPVLVYAPKIGFGTAQQEDARRAEFDKMMQKLESFGADSVLVSDDTYYKDALMIPSGGNELMTFFYMAMFAQMLACFVSCAIGNNPDSPRALSKVTVTK